MNIAEIARQAGVSNAAVSRYFNNGYLSEEKKEAIRVVVERTGYRPSLQAQTLRTKKTKLIGVILPKINSASMGSVVSGISSVLEEHGYKMLMADTQNNPLKELEYLSVFNKKQVDGIIFLATVFTPEHRKLLNNLQVPVILVGQRLADTNCIYHDDYHAARDLTGLVLKRGSKNPGFISATLQDKAAGAGRFEGFCDALRENGMDALCGQYVVAEFNVLSGYAMAGQLLEKFPDLDAIICATDSMAAGARQYLKEKGIDVPGEIMLAGFGDSVLSGVMSPTLTTVRFSYEESGRLAASMLMSKLENGTDSPRERMLGYSVIEKESTRK
ncbi:MAG: LacI family DNA-binding transcriptional regulator [Blautia sp.]|nr:LacI family DNA-binding transcriptional regulator [Blautia sp.]MDY5032613.1 LacI family DNA-binding transcriptional regulator [Blautia sp.]